MSEKTFATKLRIAVEAETSDEAISKINGLMGCGNAIVNWGYRNAPILVRNIDGTVVTSEQPDYEEAVEDFLCENIEPLEDAD